MDPFPGSGEDSVMPRQVSSVSECPGTAGPGAADAIFTVSAVTEGVGIGCVRVTGKLTDAAASRLAAGSCGTSARPGATSYAWTSRSCRCSTASVSTWSSTPTADCLRPAAP